ncbi:hypothetical protein [Dyadobacter sp. 3J3]|uniref:hypothetical protein n=1 Tax=Dyadobacter sp. 3J3 TaxID=2606600 RepID=UPI00135736F9|nr:hypothetical protein [Dyadobacter sp. 3J3]
MQIQVDIGFDQLVKIAKRLPENQWTKLKEEVEKVAIDFNDSTDLEALLLSAPTFEKNQLNEIKKTRKAINQWRKK